MYIKGNFLETLFLAAQLFSCNMLMLNMCSLVYNLAIIRLTREQLLQISEFYNQVHLPTKL